jgi:hypothetical protein
MTLGPYREGLCGKRDDHLSHLHISTSLGIFWCHADQTQRLPYAAEKRKKVTHDEMDKAI